MSNNINLSYPKEFEDLMKPRKCYKCEKMVPTMFINVKNNQYELCYSCINKIVKQWINQNSCKICSYFKNVYICRECIVN